MQNAAETSPTITARLHERASRQAEDRVFTFLTDGENEGGSLTFGELDRQARRIGGELLKLGASGERALLLYPPGLEFISAFFGCLYAGIVPVPLYPPEPARLARTLPRFVATVKDSQSAFALTTQGILGLRDMIVSQAPALAQMRWLATDALDPADGALEAPLDVPVEAPMFLQYTSGSTAAPKGVIISHANALSHYRVWSKAYGIDLTQQRSVQWVPTYHDLGLILGVLMPVYAGASVIHMSPLDFLRRPLRWLHAISRFRATMSGGPNFAYDLCVSKCTDADRARLDLSSWRYAQVGAEPTRKDTLERFSEAFGACGFRHDAFHCGYGLAEATLIVSARREHDPLVIRSVDRLALSAGKVVDVAPDHPRVQQIVGCGRPMDEQTLLIVDPEKCVPCAPGDVGEVWLSSASVGQGYWNRPAETEAVFRARLASGESGTFLRTGDLAFLAQEELFIAGRIKDLVIIRGRNHYPEDIELTVERSHPALRRGCCAVFALEVSGEECLAVLQEIEATREAEAAEALRAIRRGVAEVHDVQCHTIVLIKARTIAKTSSGKIQRHAAREALLEGSLEIVAELRLDGEAAEEPTSAERSNGLPAREALRGLEPGECERLVVAGLQTELARISGAGSAQLDADEAIVALGLDSLGAVELEDRIESVLEVHMPMTTLLDGRSMRDVARQIVARLEGAASADALEAPPVLRAAPDAEKELPASFNQERRWRIEQRRPATQNVHITTRVRGPLEIPALEAALNRIAARHEIFRTTLHGIDGRVVQRIAPAVSLSVALHDLRHLPMDEREEAARRMATETAYAAFDLARGPVLRAAVFRLADSDHVAAVSIHHVAFDLLSVGPFAVELEHFYRAQLSGSSEDLPAPELQYADYARWQRRWLQGDVLSRHLGYWAEPARTPLPRLALPYDHPESAAGRHTGATHPILLSRELSDGLRMVARREGLTVFMMLLAGLDLLLHSYARQTDIPVAINVAGRARPETKRMIGDFSHHLLLRTDLSGDPTLLETLSRVREVALGAYAHQHLPFERVVHADGRFDDSEDGAIFQVLFVFNPAGRPTLENLGFEPFPIPTQPVKHPLQLSFNDGDGELRGYFMYMAQRFETATVAGMAERFVKVIEATVRHPEQRLSMLVGSL